MRVGIAHHLGWAVAVTASADHEVVDRRRIELLEPGMPAAPVEHEAKVLATVAAMRALGLTVDAGLWGTAGECTSDCHQCHAGCHDSPGKPKARQTA